MCSNVEEKNSYVHLFGELTNDRSCLLSFLFYLFYYYYSKFNPNILGTLPFQSSQTYGFGTNYQPYSPPPSPTNSPLLSPPHSPERTISPPFTKGTLNSDLPQVALINPVPFKINKSKPKSILKRFKTLNETEVKIMNYLGVCIANLVGTQNCNDLYFAPLF
jgi:hypothetical protein